MRKSMLIWGLVLGSVCGFAGAWALQENEGEQWTPPPPLEDEWLNRHEGEWTWSGKMFMGGQEIPLEATETYKWTLNHQFLISDYTMAMGPGQPDFKGIGLTRMDPKTKEYRIWWFDVGGEGASWAGKRDGDTVTYEGPHHQGKSRSTMAMRADGTATHIVETMQSGQKEWGKFFEVEGKKKAKE